jgi:excisionase family DNA binding protein
MQNVLQSVEAEYLTKSKAQTYTGLSERSLDYARRRHELGFYKHGKRVLFKKSELDAWLERYRVCVDLQASSGHAGEATA